MPTATSGEGLYIGFEVAQHRELTQFVKGIPQAIGEPLDFTSLGITAMYPEELAVRGLGRQERRELPALVRKVQRKLSHLAIVGSQLVPNQDELVAHKGFVAIPVDPSDELAEARSVASEVVLKEMGIRLPNYNPHGWYIEVARRVGKSNNLPPYKKPLPKMLVVSGASVALRSAGDGPMRMNSVRAFVNTPRHTWRR